MAHTPCPSLLRIQHIGRPQCTFTQYYKTIIVSSPCRPAHPACRSGRSAPSLDFAVHSHIHSAPIVLIDLLFASGSRTISTDNRERHVGSRERAGASPFHPLHPRSIRVPPPVRPCPISISISCSTPRPSALPGHAPLGPQLDHSLLVLLLSSDALALFQAPTPNVLVRTISIPPVR
ncbi:hypothetical protein BD413DRAFT_213386 [Trametes elegans]|nr:hypothetical protein BD413DRAFT_213386 [Trametes elegans]